MWPLLRPRSNVVNKAAMTLLASFACPILVIFGENVVFEKLYHLAEEKNSKWPLLRPRAYLLHKAAMSNFSGPIYSLGLKLGRIEGNTKGYHFTKYLLKWPPWWPMNEKTVKLEILVLLVQNGVRWNFGTL